jgi:hypothetical protein
VSPRFHLAPTVCPNPFATLGYMEHAEANLISMHGLARELRLPAAWLQKEANFGRIPALRIGRKWLFNLQAVKAVLAERAAQPAPHAREVSA